MLQPLVGITGRLSRVSDMPQTFSVLQREDYITAYAESVAAAGGMPVLISRHSDPEGLVERLDGIVIVGGNDVDPRLYGAPVGPRSTVLDPERDRFETALIRTAVARRRPVLGICRGAQILNVALGGTLIDDLPVGTGESHAFTGYPVDHRTHLVDLAPGSLIASLVGEQISVNSYHHQAIDRPGDGLTVTGRAPDGVTEAVEMRGADVLAVQWHPEMFAEEDPVFGWLVERCAAHAVRA